MLIDAGLDLTRLDPRSTWEVFKAFAKEPVETITDPDDDLCLFEYGTFDWPERGKRFSWSLVRQFALYARGEYDHSDGFGAALAAEPLGSRFGQESV
jgi:hypothetical protein